MRFKVYLCNDKKSSWKFCIIPRQDTEEPRRGYWLEWVWVESTLKLDRYMYRYEWKETRVISKEKRMKEIQEK